MHLGTSRLRTTVAVGFAIAGVGMAIWTVVRLMPPSRVATSAAGPVRPAGATAVVAFDVDPKSETIEKAVQRMDEALGRAIAQPLPDNAPPPVATEEFRREFRDLLSLYLSGSADEFAAYLAERALEPPPNWEAPLSKEAWNDRARLLRHARMTTSDVTIRPRFLKGREILYDDQTRISTASRPERNPSLRDPALARLDVYEVLLRAEMTGIEGEKFVARLGLWLAWDDRARRWTLTHIRVYDAPAGRPVVLPGL